jgi:phosphotransferase system HPr (HPr) family protein
MTSTWLEKNINLQHKHGLHMRPAQRIVEVAKKFKSDVRACKNELDFNAKSILDMIEFAAHMVGKTANEDNSFVFRASGEDAQAALDALEALIDDRFGLE